jgi:hypothetical protein
MDESETDPEIENMDFERDRFWVAESDSEGTLSSTSSVYEEPTDDDSEEDIMVEIVRDRLMNGWTSEEEEEEEELILEELFNDEEVEIATFQVSPPIEVKDELEIDEVEAIEVKLEEPEVKKVPLVKVEIPTTPKIVKVEEKRKNGSQSTLFNSQVDVTPKPKIDLNSKITSSSNPWLALAAMNKSSSLVSPFPKGNLQATAESPSITSAATIASNLLKRSVNTNTSISNAAAALISSPAAMRTFSDIRKLDKTKINLQAKIKAAAQVAAAEDKQVRLSNYRIISLQKVLQKRLRSWVSYWVNTKTTTNLYCWRTFSTKS